MLNSDEILQNSDGHLNINYVMQNNLKFIDFYKIFLYNKYRK